MKKFETDYKSSYREDHYLLHYYSTKQKSHIVIETSDFRDPRLHGVTSHQ